ncbi:oligosaccharide flippase family protein [Listeria grandensis]|uniref:Oligosaccharide flippase family protein n=1 Tax=Listeria grandensis TaxID=1494963 RepID=A0A7X0Y4Z5_9LIST|nr:oligosaccharide flippase family protein [Listeria grandensis]MBC1937125.1 oligosaccharide flippase family protein [Listeria grandensis]
MKNALNRFLYFSLGPIAGAFISFITVPITTYFVSPDEYGKASMFIMIQTFLTVYLYLGFDQAYTRDYHEYTDKKKLIQNAMFVPLLMATLLSITAILFRQDLASWIFQDESLQLPIFLLCISMFTLIFERFCLLSIRMEERAKLYSFLTFLIRVLILCVTILYILLGDRDFTVVIYGTLIGQIVGDVVIVLLCLPLLNIANFTLDKALIRKMWIFGFPIFITLAIEAVFTISDRFIIGLRSTYTELGLYTAAFKIASLLKIVQMSFTSFWTPMAYRWHAKKKSIHYFQLASDAVAGGLSLLFMMILIFKPVIMLVFTASYQGALSIFPFLCFVPILYTISETTALGIVFSRKTYLNIYVAIGAVITNIGLAWYFVPIYGARGAALSMGIAYVIYYILRSLLSNKEWEGIRMTRQLCTVGLLFSAALYNTFFDYYSVVFNVGILICIALLYITTFNTLKKLYRN